jgi:hypothetical protein
MGTSFQSRALQCRAMSPELGARTGSHAARPGPGQLQRCICAVEHAFMPSAYLPFTGSALTCASSGCPVQSLRARLAFEGTSIEPAVTSKQLRRRGLALVDWCPSAIRSPRHADARPPLAVIAFDFVRTCCFDDALGRRKPEMR